MTMLVTTERSRWMRSVEGRSEKCLSLFCKSDSPLTSSSGSSSRPILFFSMIRLFISSDPSETVCLCTVEEQKENVNNSASLSTQIFPWLLPLIGQLIGPPPHHVILCQLQASLILLVGGSHRGDWKKCHEYLSSSVLPVSLPSSTQAHKHTLIHTTPLWTARLSFITLAAVPSERLKINVTERRRPDSQPASSRRSEEGRRFKRSQPWIVKKQKHQKHL